MKYGLQTAAIKAFLSIYGVKGKTSNLKGIKKVSEKGGRYAEIILKLLGVHYNSYKANEIQLLIQGIHLFNSAREEWWKETSFLN